MTGIVRFGQQLTAIHQPDPTAQPPTTLCGQPLDDGPWIDWPAGDGTPACLGCAGVEVGQEAMFG